MSKKDFPPPRQFDGDGQSSEEIKEAQLSPEQELAKKFFVSDILHRRSSDPSDYYNAFRSVRELHVPEKNIQEAAKQVIIKHLSNSEFSFAYAIVSKLFDTLPAQTEYLQAEDMQEAAKKGIILCLSDGRFEGATPGISFVSTDFLVSPEVQEAAKEGIIRTLSRGFLDVDFVKKFHVPEETLTSPEVKEAAKKGLLETVLIKRGDLGLKIIKEHSLSEEDIQEVEITVKMLNFFDGDIRKYIEEFNASEEVIQRAAKQAVIGRLLQDGNVFSSNFEAAFRIIKGLHVPEETLKSPEVQKAAKEGLTRILHYHNYRIAHEAIDVFSISGEDVQQVVKQAIIVDLSRDFYALNLIEEFHVPEETLKFPEVQKAARQRIEGYLSSGNVEGARRVLDAFHLPKEILDARNA